MQVFLIVSTCFLYLLAVGPLSRGEWYLQTNTWNRMVGMDVSKVGSGPGSYNIQLLQYDLERPWMLVHSSGCWAGLTPQRTSLCPPGL